jgi:hypothetical protein
VSRHTLALLAAMPAHARARTSADNVDDVLAVIAPTTCVVCDTPTEPTCMACAETMADAELDRHHGAAVRMANALQDLFNTCGAIADVRQAYESVADFVAEYKGLRA